MGAQLRRVERGAGHARGDRHSRSSTKRERPRRGWRSPPEHGWCPTSCALRWRAPSLPDVAMGTVCRATSACRLVVLCALTLVVNTALHPLVLAAFLFALTTAGTPVYPALVAATRAVIRARATGPGQRHHRGRGIGGVRRRTGTGRAAAAARPVVLRGHGDGLCADVDGIPRRRPWTRAQLTPHDRVESRAPSHQRVVCRARALCRRSARPGVTSLLAVNLLAGLEAVLLVTVADLLRDAGTAGYGTLAAASGAGAMCGVAIALVGSSRRRLPEAPAVFVVVSALSLAGLALVGNVAVAAIVVGVAGAASMLAEIFVARTSAALRRSARPWLRPSACSTRCPCWRCWPAGIAPAAIATIGARPALLY